MSTQGDIELSVISSPSERDPAPADSLYAKYVLFILMLVFFFNYVDRQILSILAESIKADLGLSDGDLGFLYGTAFAVFFAVFGIPLARLADCWHRAKLISIGLFMWSLLTALSGTAKNFTTLAFCRFGVGIGEASATPAAHSLLYDYFTPKVRTTVLAIYSCGAPIGAGLGLFLGGVILDAWNSAWPNQFHAPFGLAGWQAAFMAVGIPGVVLAVLVSTLIEPPRGESEVIEPINEGVESLHDEPRQNYGRALQVLWHEFSAMVPGVNLWKMHLIGASKIVHFTNLAFAMFLLAFVAVLIEVTGKPVQWVSLAAGIYCTFSWVQSLICRDPVCFGMLFKCKTVRYLYVSSALNTIVISALGFWMLPFFQRLHGVNVGDAGSILGSITAISGILGLLLGGALADRLRLRFVSGKIIVSLGALFAAMLSAWIMLVSDSLSSAYFSSFIYLMAVPMAAIPVSATINDLSIPRTRAVAQAMYITIIFFVGSAVGPFGVGILSDWIMTMGFESGYALQISLISFLSIFVVGIIFLTMAAKCIGSDEKTVWQRAKMYEELYLKSIK